MLGASVVVLSADASGPPAKAQGAGRGLGAAGATALAAAQGMTGTTAGVGSTAGLTGCVESLHLSRAARCSEGRSSNHSSENPSWV